VPCRAARPKILSGPRWYEEACVCVCVCGVGSRLSRKCGSAGRKWCCSQAAAEHVPVSLYVCGCLHAPLPPHTLCLSQPFEDAQARACGLALCIAMTYSSVDPHVPFAKALARAASPMQGRQVRGLEAPCTARTVDCHWVPPSRMCCA